MIAVFIHYHARLELNTNYLLSVYKASIFIKAEDPAHSFRFKIRAREFVLVRLFLSGRETSLS